MRDTKLTDQQEKIYERAKQILLDEKRHYQYDKTCWKSRVCNLCGADTEPTNERGSHQFGVHYDLLCINPKCKNILKDSLRYDGEISFSL